MSSALVLTVYIVTFTVGFPANAFTLAVLVAKWRGRPSPRAALTTADVLLLNLTAADLLLLLFLPFKMAEAAAGMAWPLPAALCPVANFCFYSSTYLSGLVLAALGLWRYLGVAFPRRLQGPRRPGRVLAVSAALWLLAAGHCSVVFVAEYYGRGEGREEGGGGGGGSGGGGIEPKGGPVDLKVLDPIDPKTLNLFDPKVNPVDPKVNPIDPKTLNLFDPKVNPVDLKVNPIDPKVLDPVDPKVNPINPKTLDPIDPKVNPLGPIDPKADPNVFRTLNLIDPKVKPTDPKVDPIDPKSLNPPRTPKRSTAKTLKPKIPKTPNFNLSKAPNPKIPRTPNFNLPKTNPIDPKMSNPIDPKTPNLIDPNPNFSKIPNPKIPRTPSLTDPNPNFSKTPNPIDPKANPKDPKIPNFIDPKANPNLSKTPNLIDPKTPNFIDPNPNPKDPKTPNLIDPNPNPSKPPTPIDPNPNPSKTPNLSKTLNFIDPNPNPNHPKPPNPIDPNPNPNHPKPPNPATPTPPPRPSPAPFRCYDDFSAAQLRFVLPLRLEFFFVLFLAPLCVTALSYAGLVRALLARPALAKAKRRRAVALAVASTAIFGLCFTPYNVSHVVGFAQGRSPPWRVYATLLSCLNAAIDPLVFYCSSGSVRAALAGLGEGLRAAWGRWVGRGAGEGR